MSKRNRLLVEWISVSVWLAFVTDELYKELSSVNRTITEDEIAEDGGSEATPVTADGGEDGEE